MVDELHWVQIPSGSSFAGSSLGELDVRNRTGATVVGVLRNEELCAHPDADFCFQVADLVAVIGTEAGYQSLQTMTLLR